MAFTRPRAAQINFDATNISDSLIRINSSETDANTNDLGIIFERGSHTNAALVFDESADVFRLISTTHSGDGDTTDINISAHHDLHVGGLTTSGLTIGATAITATAAELNILDGVTATATELNYVSGVTSAIQTQIDNISSSFTLAADSGSNDTFTTGQTLTIAGGTGIDTTVSDNNISIAIDSTVATLTGTQTLTNKTLTNPTINAFSGTGDGSITGALTVSGTVNFDDTTGSTSTTTGALIVDGGVGIAENLYVGGTIDMDRLSLTSSQTTVPPLRLTANSLQDGVGALRIDGTQADIYLNPSTATHTTVTFAVNEDQRLAFGMDNNSDFYITRRTSSTWYDDTFVLDRDTGLLSLGYGATVAGTLTYSTLNDGTTALTSTVAELNYVDGVTSNIQTQIDGKLALTGGAMTGAITTNSTFDGRDVATDGTKLDTIETNADVTDATNVAAAGALMESEVTNLAQVKAFDSTDYATAAQGTTADAALPKAGGTMSGAIAMGTNKITGMGDPTAAQDAATKAYVDSQVSSVPTGDITAVNITAGTGLSGTVSTASGDHTQTLSIDSTVATLTGSQTLTNKTLTAPVISSISNTGTLTLPTSTGTVALTSDIPTAVSELTNDSGYSTTTGTVTQVAMTVPTGLTVSGTPISTTGTLAVAFDTGYAISTTAKQTQWDTAYGWGDHSAAGYITGYTVTESDVTTHQAALSITESQISDLGAYATLASPTLTGTPAAPTATAGTNTTQIATTAFVSTAVANIVDSAPAALDTLNELAAALGDDANFATTTATSLGEKLVKASNLSDLTDASAARTNLGLGTAATTAATAYATAAQGALADSATQPSDNVSTLTNDSGYITASTTDTLTNKTLTSPQVNTNIDLLAQADVRFYDADSSNYVGFQSPATATGNILWTLPGSDGTEGQVLSTNGGGTLTWEDPGSGGGSGSSYPNSTFSTVPGTNGDFDLSYNVAQTTQETPFELGGTDAFGVNLGSVFSLMDPIGSIESIDYGDSEAYVGA